MSVIPKKIAIIGVGLIGGSIALGLKRQLGATIKIFGSCSTSARSKKAKHDGVIDEIFDVKNMKQNIGLFIIATPILKIPEIIKELAKIKNKAVIMDTASTKDFVIKSAVGLLPRKITFSGTHPMAGSEVSGFENADPNLFRNKPWIVCGNSTIVNELINLLGAKIVLMDSKKHDKFVSWASHLNLVCASLLTNTIARQHNWKDVAKIASTGFRDTTRLASSSVEVKKDIILTNKENIIDTLIKLRAEIDMFINLIKANDANKITNYLLKAKAIRDEWLTNYFS